jgi:hypothetical protein
MTTPVLELNQRDHGDDARLGSGIGALDRHLA